MPRHFALLLTLLVCFLACSRNQVAWEQSAREEKADPVEKAVQAIEALGGWVTRDEKLPGRPNLCGLCREFSRIPYRP